LTLALHNYVSVHGHFPPAYSVDKDGRPLHSWRTLILPYLDQGGQYRAIDLTKPWDDPVNAAFAFPVPDIFRCPGVDAAADDPTTNYIGVVGKETAWKPGGETITFSDGSDGCSATIAIIESTNHRVHWMAPDNLKSAELLRLIKREGDATIQSPHPGGFNTGWLDGSYRWFSNEDVVEGLPAALTIAGGEGVKRDE
jgi:prepilin-type processing-associated H-X9-DG protein